MNVTFSTPGGPLEGFTEAEFRVAINDDGIGKLVGPPEVVDGINGPVTCSVDGVPVFRWSVEERNESYADDDTSTVNGRGRTGALDRAIVLPVGYPNFTDRTRTEQGSPFGIWADLLAEAQGRNRVTDITPTWTPTNDSNGVPWKETIDIQLEPGTNLRSLLSNVTEVEGAEWFLRPDGNLDAATVLGQDLSGQVVLFVPRHQVTRSRRLSSRDQRQTIYIEASTGVSEAANTLPDDAGEIWLEAQDYADVLSRQAIADKLAEKLDNPQEEVDITVSADCGIFDTFTVGDRIGLDVGNGAIQTVRVVGALISVTDVVDVELTLISEVALRQQKIDRAIEAKADVQLAATPAIQRRHGLVTADKFLSGAVGSDVAISSENFVPAIPGPGEGWAIFGDGNAEFNDAIFRGDLQSDNYVPLTSGWALSSDGDAELNQAILRGFVRFTRPPALPNRNYGTFTETAGIGIDFGYIDPDTFVDIFSGGIGAVGDGTPEIPPPDLQGVVVVADETLDDFSSITVLNTGITAFAPVENPAGFHQTFGREILSRYVDFCVIEPVVGVSPTTRHEVQIKADETFVLDGRFTVQDGAVFAQQGLVVNNFATEMNAGAFVRNFRLDALAGALITGGLTVTNVGITVQAGGMTVAGGLSVSSNGLSVTGGASIANGMSVTSDGLSIGANGGLDVSGFTRLRGNNRIDGTVDNRNNVFFRNTGSGRRMIMDDAGSGSQGTEPTLDTTGDLFGFVGIPSRRMFRMHAGAFLTSSESRLKGEVVDADLAYCYDTLRNMRLTRYSLQKDRDAYYISKGEAFLSGQDFDDPGAPQQKLGIMAEEAPAEVSDETHQNIDVYAYASLIAGAVKALQDKVEALEDHVAG